MKVFYKKLIIIAVIFICILSYELKAGTDLSCTITENLTLTKELSPYLVNCNIKVQPGVKIVIEKGVEIRFSGFYNFEVYGVIEVNGTKDEPVIFEPANNKKFWGTLILQESTGNCYFTNMLIKNGIIKALDGTYKFDSISIIIEDKSITDVALYAERSDINVKNSYLKTNGISEGIHIFSSESPLIENCIAINTADSYQFVKCNNGAIVKNISINSSDDAIDQNGCINTLITSNLLIKPKDKGISIGHDGSGSCKNILIERNIIINAAVGLELKSGSTVTVSNNTLIDNTIAINCFEKNANTGGAIVKVLNTLIFGSKINIKLDEKSEISIRYSLTDNEILTGEHNLMGNPLFFDTASKNFHLLYNSPCIDAGDPDSRYDADGTIADIGAIFYNQQIPKIVINEINYNSSLDFDSGDWLELYNADSSNVDLSNWILSASDEAKRFVFPNGIILYKNEYIIVAGDTNKFFARYSENLNIFPAKNFNLNNSGDSFKLIDSIGRLIDSITFQDSFPWPDANGNGATIGLINPLYNNALPENWLANSNHGNPGKSNDSTTNDIEEQETERINVISIFPNPAKEKLFVKFNNNTVDNFKIDIYNIFGDKFEIRHNRLSLENECFYEMNITNLPSGVYYLVIFNSNGFISELFIILR